MRIFVWKVERTTIKGGSPVVGLSGGKFGGVAPMRSVRFTDVPHITGPRTAQGIYESRHTGNQPGVNENPFSDAQQDASGILHFSGITHPQPKLFSIPAHVNLPHVNLFLQNTGHR